MTTKKKQQPAIIVAVTVGVLVIAYLVYDRLKPGCEGIFQQSSVNIGAKIDTIKTKGEVFIGREKIQELTDSSQKVGQHLKTCCTVLEGGKLNPDQFQKCVESATAYQNRVEQIANAVTEVVAAKQQGNEALVAQKSGEINAGIQGTAAFADNLGKQIGEFKATLPTQPMIENRPGRGDTAHEPNNTILEANQISINRTIRGTITNGDGIDFFAFRYDSKVRDILKINIVNLSTALVPNIQMYDHNKAVMTGTDARTAGANTELSFSADPGEAYYFAVSGHYWPGYESAGDYKVEVIPQKAFDEYEPNDDAFSATPLKPGRTVVANIMDDKDVDWYRLSDIKQSKINLRIENLSTTLVPNIQIYDHNKVSLSGTDTRTPGANTEFSFSAQAGQDYYIIVTGRYWPGYFSIGRYKLSVTE